MNGQRARLNVFQKTQRLWDTIHPYNAAQAMELVGEFSAESVDAAFNAALGDLGLGDFVCEGNAYFVRPARSPVSVARPSISFEDFVSAEMNRPFDAGVSMPFRPFDFWDNGRHFVGLTYQHWVADSVSIRMLMRQWLLRLTGGGGRRPVKLPTAGLLGTFSPATTNWSVTAQAASVFSLSSRMRKMRRVAAHEDRSVRVLLRAGDDGLMEAVRQRARRDGATVGDVLLAATVEASMLHGPAIATRRHPGLCMGSIVDLRARGGSGRGRRAENVFGLFLGFLMTDFSPTKLATFQTMLGHAIAARRTSLARRSAEASQLNLTLAYALGRLLGPKKLVEFYRKRYPISAGLSSVNMTPGWAGELHPSPLAAYHRVSPTGPMLPLVLTPTTLGDRLNVCFTYRPALMDEPQADALVGAVLKRLGDYAGRHAPV